MRLGTFNSKCRQETMHIVSPMNYKLQKSNLMVMRFLVNRFPVLRE